MNLPTATTFYSPDNSLEAHRLRFLATERNPEILHELPGGLPASIVTLLAKRQAQPEVLIDKSIIVYGRDTLEQYLLERYPGENLLVQDPIGRATIRMLADEVRGWYDMAEAELVDKLHEFSSCLSTRGPWFTGKNFSLIDIAAAPLIWQRIIDVPSMNRYRAALLARPAFWLARPSP